jgi:hypothetical protein
MANKTKAQLKAMYEWGDEPTESNYEDLIDSCYGSGAVDTTDITDISVVTGAIVVPVTTPVVKITATDSSDIETITVTASTFYKFVIWNESGSGVKFVAGDNIYFGQSVSLDDGQFMECYAIDGDVYVTTTAAGVKGFSYDEKAGGVDNIWIGENAGSGNTADTNIGIGLAALRNNTGDANICIGTAAGDDNEGIDSIGIGSGALEENTGNYCIGIGNKTLFQNTEDYKFNISSANAGAGVLYGGYLDTAERIYNYKGIGLVDNLIYVIDYSKSFDDDASSSITPKNTVNVGSVELTVLTGSTLYAARYSITGSATQLSWADGAVFDVSDTDNKVCVYYDTGVLKVKNRLGATAHIVISMKYQESTS